MRTFLSEILQKITAQESFNFSETTFVFPSKRAGSFLKRSIKEETDYSGFTPDIISVEDFITEITNLTPLDHINTLFRFYDIYRQLTPEKEQEDFNTFYGWAQTLIYDFNEIDRYLVDTKAIFRNLADTENIKNWTPEGRSEPTGIVKNYLKFWKKLPQYHHHFVQALLQNNEAYQGLIYRQATLKIEDYLQNKTGKIIFIGFNALNKAEKIIIKTILQQNRGQIFWDIDRRFIDDRHHKAGYFMRRYRRWDYYTQHQNKFESLGTHFEEPKIIKAVGIPKNIGQAKYVGEILKNYQPEGLQNTAVVLNDENLLSPVLNSLPESIHNINITMGLPLGMTPLASLFELLFKIQEDEREALYYKPVQEILSHPFIRAHLDEKSPQLQEVLAEKNLVFISKKDILDLTETRKTKHIISLCFSNYKNDLSKFLSTLIELSEYLSMDAAPLTALEIEYLYRFNKLFKKLENLLEKYEPYKNAPLRNTTIKSLHTIYRDLLKAETLDFEGSPFDGLQLMGMLETRGLDYETIILTSVNEGILPSGKSGNSYIPYDLKNYFGLPTYTEKDAVYSYHFYRLLQRAKKVYLLYNTDQSGFNAGEKSRFIRQLDIESTANHKFESIKVNWQVQTPQKELQQIRKTSKIIDQLKHLACRETENKASPKGFSPSALTTYIRNPIDFYKKYVLGIKEPEEVEETVAPNTLGTVVHETLEKFYKPYADKQNGKSLSLNNLDKMLKETDREVENQFAIVYQDAPLDRGKNRIIREIAKHYIHRFLEDEKEKIKHGYLKILHIEDENLSYKLDIPELKFPVYLNGKVDRVDQYGDQIRVVDYKTGGVTPPELKISDWDDLTKDKKYNKAFQVLCYALLLHKTKGYNEFETGIISFKKMGNGFLKLGIKEGNSKKFNYGIDRELLHHFEQKLALLVKEIFNPEEPFKDKEG